MAPDLENPGGKLITDKALGLRFRFQVCEFQVVGQFPHSQISEWIGRTLEVQPVSLIDELDSTANDLSSNPQNTAWLVNAQKEGAGAAQPHLETSLTVIVVIV